MATEDIGRRLREARLKRGASLRGLAASLNVSPSLISQIENGKVLPSVSTLYAMASELDASLDDLLRHVPGRSGSTPRATDPVIQRAADNPVIEMTNDVRWERLAGSDTAVDALMVTYGPGAASAIDHSLMCHTGTEYAFIIEGELTLTLDDETHLLRAGDSLHFDSGRRHLYANEGTAPARGIWFVIGGHGRTEPPGGCGKPESAVDVLHVLGGLG